MSMVFFWLGAVLPYHPFQEPWGISNQLGVGSVVLFVPALLSLLLSLAWLLWKVMELHWKSLRVIAAGSVGILALSGIMMLVAWWGGMVWMIAVGLLLSV